MDGRYAVDRGMFSSDGLIGSKAASARGASNRKGLLSSAAQPVSAVSRAT
ncbi:MAG: hypothetical protein NVS3B5_23460 [Sphingomicrobium sp.]